MRPFFGAADDLCYFSVNTLRGEFMERNSSNELIDANNELSEQINLAFKKYAAGESVFVDSETAKARMADFKAQIKDISSQ